MEFNKAKLIWIVLLVGALLVGLFSSGLYGRMLPSVNESSEQKVESQETGVVRTVPDPLNGATLLPNQTIELQFSDPLVNVPETRWTISPNVDLQAELSDDRKTLKLIPNKPYELGSGYTLTIKGETKVEGRGTLNKELIYSFKTIEFKGS